MQLTGPLPMVNAVTDLVRIVKARAKEPKMSSVSKTVASSGRLHAMIVDNGGALDVDPGIHPPVNQQVVMVNCKENTCEELANGAESLLMAVPALDIDTYKADILIVLTFKKRSCLSFWALSFI